MSSYRRVLAENLRTALIRSSRTLLWSATAVGLFILLSFFAAISYDSYRSTLQARGRAATNIATLIEQDVARNIELFDLSLQAVVEGVNDPEVMSQKPRLRQKTLFDRSVTARGMGAVVALDETGSIFLDSLGDPPRQGNFAGREHFVAQRDSVTDIGLYLSRPFKERLQGDIWSISVSRRISRSDGSFGGIVSSTLRLEYFQHLFEKVALGIGGTLTLFRDDGTLLVRNVADDDLIGSNWHGAPVFAQFSSQAHGLFTSDQSKDGVGRLYAFSRVGQLPLIVVVALPLRETLAPWWFRILIYSAIFAVMAASVVLLVWVLEKELGRRATAERAAALLARTDALTKLANRRAFEEGLSREWARGARYGRPVSLIMIDVDRFKLFNDTYGHQAGDNTLMAVAGIIAQASKRPGDLAARYGGEEFAILLPDTDQRGATQIAEAIRDGVVRLRIDHAGSDHKVVTVSAGVATGALRSGLTATSLIHDADAALYRAKAQGRNEICGGNVLSTDFDPQLSRAS
jgi:diguanylate cyclase (GGDEF)-like protein